MVNKFDYYKKAKVYLTHQPLARNVDNRATAIWNLVKIHFVPSLEVMDKQIFTKYFSKAQSFDRAIRRVQEENPELRHNENLKNQELQVKSLKELGYML